LPKRAEAAWYRAAAFVLPNGHPLRDTIAVIPFAAVKRDDGSFAFAEGLEGSSVRDGPA
jgi:hypothetical protein